MNPKSDSAPKKGGKKRRIITVKKSILGTQTSVDYKDIDLLKKFLNMKGRITSRRLNGNNAKQQRAVSLAVKRARFMALLPFATSGSGERERRGSNQ